MIIIQRLMNKLNFIIKEYEKDYKVIVQIQNTNKQSNI